MPIRHNLWSIILAAVAMCAVVVAIFISAPKSEDFWWTDGASFALNGALIHDYIASGFHIGPVQYANDWFRYFPALTISLYPPIFPLSEAVAFSVFGFSHPVAQATVAAFTGLAAFGLYRACRTAQDPLAATGAVLLMFSAPNVLLWSRQVMMELPTLAFLLLAAGNLLRYQASRHRRDLMIATALALAGIYTKQTAIFIAPAFAMALILDDGFRALRDRTVWIAAAFGAVGMIPLLVFTLETAPAIVDIALGQGIAVEGNQARFAQMMGYVRTLPDVVGWPVLLASVCCIGFIAVGGWRSVAERRLVMLMLAWFVCDFIFLSTVGHFELRYAMALAVPCAVAAGLSIARLFRRKLAPWAVLCAGGVCFLAYFATQSVDRMSGYDKIAAYLLEHSHQDDVVWFQGAESKNLAFSLRSHESKPKLVLLRAEKFLADYHIIREWGVTDRGMTPDAMRDLIDREHVSIIVLQPGFWSDLPSVAGMQDYILSDRFRQVAEFPVTADEASQRATIKIFVPDQAKKPEL
jgi:hypothetical protein